MFSNVFQAINNNFDAFNRNQQKVSNLYTPKQLLEVFYKNVFLKISQSLQENTRPATQVFSCELCEIFKNTCFKNTTGEVLLDTQILNTEKIKRQVFQSFYDANTRHIQVRF